MAHGSKWLLQSISDRWELIQFLVMASRSVDWLCNWDSEQSAKIATEFCDELLHIIQTECSCQIGQSSKFWDHLSAAR